MRLERLDCKVEVSVFGNCKVVIRVHGAFDECLGSDVIGVRHVGVVRDNEVSRGL